MLTGVSLFSGYGGLEEGLRGALDVDVRAHAEIDPAACRVLAARFPGVPNLGDVADVDWAAVREQLGPVDVLSGGFPCQDVAFAGLRRGIVPGSRSGLWAEFARAIDALRPSLVLIENVRGLTSAPAHRPMESDEIALGDGSVQPALRALGAVLGDLADLRLDAEWIGVRASDVGAPHERFRIFLAAAPPDSRGTARDLGRRLVPSRPPAVRGRRPDDGSRSSRYGALWPYGAALDRWAATLGRDAPPAQQPGGGTSPDFVEWMMGLPAGWVTDPDLGISRGEQLRLLGNGVVPQQAEKAVRLLLSRGR